MPKINFVINPKASAESIISLLNSGFRAEAKKAVLKDHPDLRSIIGKKDKVREITPYVMKYFEKNKEAIEEGKNRIEKEWRKVAEKVFSELSLLLNTDWEGLGEITCNISIFQMFPRDLEKFSFDVYFQDYVSRSMVVILHELTHFIYFKKWKELFPGDKNETFEFPHKFWHLSEIMAPIINEEKELLKLVPKAETDAEEETTLEYFKKKYMEYKNKGKSIEEFLKFAREKIQKIDINNNFPISTTTIQ